MHAMRTTAALLLAFGLSGALLETGAAESQAATAPNTAAAEGDSLRGILEGILAKEGITVGGVFRSQFLHSSIGGAGAVPVRRSEESIEYTSVDFDIRARPSTLTQGRLVFRMHQDWRNFFSDIGNPIHTRWISLDGKAAGMFSYNVGDFRKHYSPLTLHSPDIDLLYEPEYYASQRRDAMDEVFLGNNDRLLQGVNLNLDAALDNAAGGNILPGLHLNLLGARLRNVETSLGDGSKVTAFTEKWHFEKFLGAANADIRLPFGFSVGGSHLTIFDKKGTFNPAVSGALGNPDTLAQFTQIWSGRGGFDLAKALGWENASLSLSGEYATSADDSSSFAIGATDTTLKSVDITGAALMAGIQGGWKPSSKAFSVRGGLNYLRNEQHYRNELAQSPTFRGQRIMNIENDSTPGLRALSPQAAQYSTFDALYRHAFKFTPSAATNAWHKAPFSKGSYDRSIAMQSELASLSANRLDTSLQLVMPFGPATPNRVGIDSRLTGGFWEERIEATLLYAGLKEIVGRPVDSVRSLPVTAFAQMGGGLKLEVGAMLGLPYPLTLSGSLVRSTAENDGIAGDTVFTARTVESDFISAGLRYKFWKRAAVLGGFQEIRTRNVRAATLEEVQRNLGGGLEYRISDGAYVLGGLNQVSVTPPEGSVHKEFSQIQTDLRLNVRF